MKLVDLMSEELILPELEAGTKSEVLDQLVGRIASIVTQVDRSEALRVLMARERIGSTGVGDGIAIPHAKLPALERGVACLARSREGVDFGALDGRPTHLVLALLAPEGRAGVHLKALARASRLFKNAALRRKLIESADGPGLWTTLREGDAHLGNGA